MWLSDAGGTRDVAGRASRGRRIHCGPPEKEGGWAPAEVIVAWWVAEKGAPTELLGPTEISQEAAKRSALARSKARPGTVFQVRYHVNANGATEVRWEVVDGNVTEVTGDAQKRP